MKQRTFSEVDFATYSKSTRKQEFLRTMNDVLPWDSLIDIVQPYYPNKKNGRPSIKLETMLRIHFLQIWYGLSDPAAEEAIYDSLAMREFAQIDLGTEGAPDETTICRFRHLLEKYSLGKKIFEELNEYLTKCKIQIRTGTIVDATIISAPSSTKNKNKARDPEMHQTRKGNQWYFGMKLHIGVDSRTGLIHSMATTPANTHDSKLLPELLHGKERRIYGDSAYRNQKKKFLECAPFAKDFTNERAYRNTPLDETVRKKNRYKSSLRAKVEHPFLFIKRHWHSGKIRYKGLEKNTNWYYIVCGLVNIYRSRRKLLPT